MGARATIRVIHPRCDTPIHLYTHWRGNEITEILAQGIRRADLAGRLSDYAYATRIIFDTLTQCTGDETGYGICIGDDAQPADIDFDTPTIAWLDYSEPEVSYGALLMDAKDFADAILGKVVLR